MIKRRHREWLRAVEASDNLSFDYLGITPRRLEILENLGLIEFKGGKYVLTTHGKIQVKINLNPGKIAKKKNYETNNLRTY